MFVMTKNRSFYLLNAQILALLDKKFKKVIVIFSNFISSFLEKKIYIVMFHLAVAF